MEIQENVDLTPYLTMRVKGKARYFCVAKSEKDFTDAFKFSQEKGLPFYILGGGSNVVLGNEVYPGLIIKNEHVKIREIREIGDIREIRVTSGYPTGKLVNEAIKNGWGGIEYFAGLPGTVGGAVVCNSHWGKPETHIKDLVKKANYYKNILLEVTLELTKENPDLLLKRAREVIEYRKKTQPAGFSSGCIFINPSSDMSAGQLIDQAGLKGERVGAFSVSEKHANFILCDGHGKPEDLLKLINIIKKKIKERFNVNLQEEVQILNCRNTS